ncbi:MAG: SLC13 family permease, partial [Chloroflexota bacterium]
YQVERYLSEILIPEGSDLHGKTLAEAQLRQQFGVQVLGILRDGHRSLVVRGDTVLRSGDELLVSASADELARIREDSNLEIAAEARHSREDQYQEELRWLEIVIARNSRLIGGTLISTNFRNRYGATVIAMRKQGRVIRERLGDVRFEFGDTLLVQGPPSAIERLKREREFIVTEEAPIESFRTRKIPIAVGIVIGVVGIASLGQPILVTAIVGSVLMVLTGCLTVRELHDSIRWDVIFLLAGMIPLGIALENTGGTALLADLAAGSGDFLPAVAVLGVFYALTTVMTSLISNNASVVVMVPIGIATATSIGADPKAFVLAIMFAASTAFATPMGYQTNTMVYGPGGYTFMDYVRVGGPLNVILAILTPVFIWLIWGL